MRFAFRQSTHFLAKASWALVVLAAVALVTFIFVSGCASSDQELNGSTSGEATAARVVSAEEAREMMSSQEVVVLDVRTQEEYDEGHICNAILLPLDALTEETALAAVPNKGQIVLVYCRSGRRSAEAAARLSGMGYEQVYDFGGIQSWTYEVCTE